MQRNEDLSRVTPLTPPPLRTIAKSSKLADVCYDIRGPVLQEATRLEEEGHRVIKLNIGNPAPFGFEAPEEIVIDVIHHLRESQGYCDSKGLVQRAQGDHAVLPAAADSARRNRRHLYRQRRQRADRDGDAGAVEQRRRNPGSGARLSAVDRCHHVVRRQSRALPLRRAGRLATRSRGHEEQDHAAHARHRRDQSEQSHRRRVLAGDAERHRRDRAAERPDPVRRRNLRQDHLRRRRTYTARVARTRPARAVVQRSVENLSRRRASAPAGW